MSTQQVKYCGSFLSIAFTNKTTMFDIHVQSGLVNGFVFIVFDIIALWAVHRGLMALQGLFISFRVRSGKPVKLKRSSVPLLSGELLVQERRGPNILVILHGLALILAFAAAFGINGTSKPLSQFVKRKYISIIDIPRTIDRTRARLRSRVFLRCKKLSDFDTTTHSARKIEYKEGAFDVTNGATLQDRFSFKTSDGKQHHVNASRLECQDGAMITLSKCEPASVGCESATDANEVTLTLYEPAKDPRKGSALVPDERIGNATTLHLLRRTVKSSTNEKKARPNDRLICIETPLAGSDSTEGSERLNCFLVRWSKDRSSARVAFGHITTPKAEFDQIDKKPVKLEILTAMGQVSPTNDNEFLFSEGLRGLGSGSYSLEDTIDNLVINAIAANRQSDDVKQFKMKDITELKLQTVVCLSVLAVSAIVLVALREIIKLILMSKGTYVATLLDANRYDTLSSMLRDADTGAHSIEITGKHATLGVYDTDNGAQRIGHVPSTKEPSKFQGVGEYRPSISSAPGV